MKPFVGPPTAEGAGCAFSPALDTPPCGQPTTLHVGVKSAWGNVSLSSCDAHADIARATGESIGEHPFGAGCKGGACWTAP